MDSGSEEVTMTIAKLWLAALPASFAWVLGVAQAQETATKGIFHSHGIVKAVAPQTGALTVSHDEIKGFMPAMEMMYRVRSPEVSKGLKPGDTVDFTIDAAKYVILDVTVVAHAK
jgi:Cu/Ag efflux protein CusF